MSSPGGLGAQLRPRGAGAGNAAQAARAVPCFAVYRSIHVYEAVVGDIDRIFDDFGVGRSFAPLLSDVAGTGPGARQWVPQIEVFERGGQLELFRIVASSFVMPNFETA